MSVHIQLPFRGPQFSVLSLSLLSVCVDVLLYLCECVTNELVIVIRLIQTRAGRERDLGTKLVTYAVLSFFVQREVLEVCYSDQCVDTS